MLDTVVKTNLSLSRTPLLNVFRRVLFKGSLCSRITIHGWTVDSGSRYPQFTIGSGAEVVVVIFESNISGSSVVVDEVVVVASVVVLVVELEILVLPKNFLFFVVVVLVVVVEGVKVVLSSLISVVVVVVGTVNHRRLAYLLFKVVDSLSEAVMGEEYVVINWRRTKSGQLRISQ